MHHKAWILLAVLTPAATSAQSVGNAALIGCSAKADDAERLACYDGLARAISQSRSDHSSKVTSPPLATST